MAKLTALIITLAMLLGSSAAEAARRVALVIGNGAYSETTVLPNPPNDARAIGAAMERMGFEVHLAIDQTQAQMLAAVDAYAKALEGAEAALLFYAGHGVQIDGRNFLLPTDIKAESERSLRYGSLDINEVVAEMERASPVNIVLLDACRDNPFVEQVKRSLKTRSTSIATGLAPIKVQSSGTIIGYAAAPGAVAADGEGANSPYTAALLQEIEKPGVEVALALRRAAAHVIEGTKGEQRPELLVRLVNEFYLNQAAAEPTVAVAEPKPEVKVETPPKPVEIVEIAEAPRYVVPRVQWSKSAAKPPNALDWRPQPAEKYGEGDDNNSLATATRIKLDAAIEAAIMPKGDNDHYRFEVPLAGALTVSAKQMPATIDLVARLLDANLQVVADWQVAPRPGGDLDVVFDVPRPGTYTLVTADNYNDAEAPQPFWISLAYAPALDGYEPNGTIGAAWPIELSGEVKATIFPKGDQDWYRFWAEQPGRIEVKAHGVPPELDIAFRLYNADGTVIHDWQVAPRPGGETLAVFDLKLPGAYFLELADSYNDGRSVVPYTLTTVFAPSVDGYEPNDSFAEAVEIPATGTRRLTVLPKADADWFRLDVDHPGELKLGAFDVPASLDVAFRVHNRDKQVIADWMVPPRPGGDTVGSVDLGKPGAYYIEIADSYNDQGDIAFYRFETAYTPEPDQYEPNNTIGAATLVSTDSEFLFNILPRGDADWFALQVDSPGELKISIDEGPKDLDLHYRVWNADRQVIRDWVAPYSKGGLTEGFADLPQAGTYFIEVVDGANDARSVEPATLQTHFTPAKDSYEPNNSFGAASPVEAQGSWQAHILPQGDSDWFRLEAPGAGELTVGLKGVPEPLDIYFRLWDANGGASNWYGPAKPNGDYAVPLPVSAAGIYRLEVVDGNNDARSPLPFSVSWSFAAKP
jgi:hypothetical protein